MEEEKLKVWKELSDFWSSKFPSNRNNKWISTQQTVESRPESDWPECPKLLSPISQEPVSSPATGDLNLICNQSRGILKSVRIIRKASTSQWDGYIRNFSNVRHRKTEKLLFHQHVWIKSVSMNCVRFKVNASKDCLTLFDLFRIFWGH